MINSKLLKKIINTFDLIPDMLELSDLQLHDVIELIVESHAHEFTSSELIAIFLEAQQRKYDAVQCLAIDLMEFCRNDETTILLRELYSDANSEEFDVSLIYEFWHRTDTVCEDLLPFLIKSNSSLVRQLAARGLILIGNVPSKEQLKILLTHERDIQVKLNYHLILYILSLQSGALDILSYKYIKKHLESDDIEISQEANECMEFTSPKVINNLKNFNSHIVKSEIMSKLL